MPDSLLNKQVILHQPDDAFRTGLDAVLLSACMPALKTGRILDAGCGVGAVSLCYAMRHDNDVRITGLELHETFKGLAEQNVIENNLSHRVDIIHGDLKDNIFGNDVFNGVMTNPPFEKSDSADRANTTLKDIANIESTVDLLHWITQCLRALKARGYFTIIHKMERLDSILHALHGVAGDIQILPIQTKYKTAPKRVIVVARKGIKTGVKMYPVFCMQNQDGSYTKKAQEILEGQSCLNIINNTEWKI